MINSQGTTVLSLFYNVGVINGTAAHTFRLIERADRLIDQWDAPSRNYIISELRKYLIFQSPKYFNSLNRIDCRQLSLNSAVALREGCQVLTLGVLPCTPESKAPQLGGIIFDRPNCANPDQMYLRVPCR